MPRRLAEGAVLTFQVRERNGLCQIIKTTPETTELVVFDAFFVKHPTASDIDGKPLFVARTEPRNQPFYFSIVGQPPPYFRAIGTRPVALAFALPKTFRASPTSEEIPLPVEAAWSDVTSNLRAEFRSRGVPPEPYTSTHFPAWTVDPASLRLMDQLIDVLQKALADGTGLAALSTTVNAFNRLEDDLTSATAKELSAKLLSLATAAGLDKKKAQRVIDDNRNW